MDAQVRPERMRQARARKVMNQEQLAEASGLSLPTIKRLEKLPGPNPVRANSARALMKALDVAAEDLLEIELATR